MHDLPYIYQFHPIQDLTETFGDLNSSGARLWDSLTIECTVSCHTISFTSQTLLLSITADNVSEPEAAQEVIDKYRQAVTLWCFNCAD